MTVNPIKELATFYDVRYQAHVGTRYPFNGGKDAKILKELREIYSDDDLHIYMVAFFEIEDGFIEDSGYGLGVFRGCLPKVIQYVRRQGRPRVRAITALEREQAQRVRHTWGRCQHDPECESHAACLVAIVMEWRQQETAALKGEAS